MSREKNKAFFKDIYLKLHRFFLNRFRELSNSFQKGIPIKITAWKKHDYPLFKILLKPFKILGTVFADTGYLSRANFQLCMDKKRCLFVPFKKNSRGGSRGSSVWKFAFNLYKKCNWIYENIYHQRSKVESVFSVIKKRFGDKVSCKSALMRRKEIAWRLIAYNLRILIFYQYANKHNLPLWVRVKKN
ncbi:MAG TPA: transposase [Candidatus Nanoarchaeia archaeon]|nr:transposase [Candidatus Nanoarchaeia archaeon]